MEHSHFHGSLPLFAILSSSPCLTPCIDIVGLTVEHIHYSHPSVILLLAKLFQLIMASVLIPKAKNTRSKALTCDDFRGAAISSVISKIFEHCVIDRFRELFSPAENQFGFKKGLSCSHAVYSTRRIVDNFIKGLIICVQ